MDYITQQLGPFHLIYDSETNELKITVTEKRAGKMLILPSSGNAVTIECERDFVKESVHNPNWIKKR